MVSNDDATDPRDADVVLVPANPKPLPRVKVPVPDDIRGLLCALVYGWTPTLPNFGAVAQVSLGDADLSTLNPSLEVRGSTLVTAFDARGARNRLDELMPFDLDSKLHGSLDGGTTFEVQRISQVHRRGGFSVDDGASASLEIQADDWTAIEGDTPSIWVGRMEGMGVTNFGGNLIVERVERDGIPGGRRGHFHLSGVYLYYLVRTQDRTSWWLVVDTRGGGLPDWELLSRDLLTLQFVLGRQLRLPLLIGLTADRQTKACTATSTPRNTLEEGSFPPVPFERNNESWIDEAWVPVFFEHISAGWRTRQDMNQIFWMALDMYLDAMRNFLDSDYMRLHIALEAFAYALLKTDDDERVDVKDRKAWKKWVKNNEPDIRAHAVDGRQDALYNKVMAAARLSSGKVVPRAFAECGLSLTEDMRKELEGRDFVIHQGLMSPGGYVVDRDVKRVALVRTMLVALVARAVGYGGAINGWEIGRLGRPIEPQGWWSVTAADRDKAQVAFVAEERLS